LLSFFPLQLQGAIRLLTGITVISEFLLLLLQLLLRRDVRTDAHLRSSMGNVCQRLTGSMPWLENLSRWGVLEFRQMVAVRVRRDSSPVPLTHISGRFYRRSGACCGLISEGGLILKVSPGRVDQDKG
jgi:hypothetical protein